MSPLNALWPCMWCDACSFVLSCCVEDLSSELAQSFFLFFFKLADRLVPQLLESRTTQLLCVKGWWQSVSLLHLKVALLGAGLTTAHYAK